MPSSVRSIAFLAHVVLALWNLTIGIALALLETVARRSDSTFERHFVSYITVCLRRYAARWKNTLRRRSAREALMLNETAFDDEGNPLALNPRPVPVAPSAEDVSLQGAPLQDLITDYGLYLCFQGLTRRQQHVLMSLIIKGESQEKVARSLGVTQQAVGRSKSQALQRLRASIGARG